jgi:hypothetical protein
MLYSSGGCKGELNIHRVSEKQVDASLGKLLKIK